MTTKTRQSDNITTYLKKVTKKKLDTMFFFVSLGGHIGA